MRDGEGTLVGQGEWLPGKGTGRRAGLSGFAMMGLSLGEGVRFACRRRECEANGGTGDRWR